ncbi:hypothetical protein PsorP6_008703 [Peronosclerospora sorghi]|uniref:Uncharacterized protein n=1 Tax=Peronosclerospora sorghi TaxID=230839 RepID=A0ACC0W085_9STRA|nr:hypothetical protein PsorP6_008703 [Peronosclerospora sorghi]
MARICECLRLSMPISDDDYLYPFRIIGGRLCETSLRRRFYFKKLNTFPNDKQLSCLSYHGGALFDNEVTLNTSSEGGQSMWFFPYVIVFGLWRVVNRSN